MTGGTFKTLATGRLGSTLRTDKSAMIAAQTAPSGRPSPTPTVKAARPTRRLWHARLNASGPRMLAITSSTRDHASDHANGQFALALRHPVRRRRSHRPGADLPV